MNKKSVSGSELKVMEKIWESERMLTIAEILAALTENGEEWTYKTVAMLLVRLAEKKYVSSTKSTKGRLKRFAFCFFKQQAAEKRGSKRIERVDKEN